MLTFLIGLSLEFMDELFEQKNVRAKFVPTRVYEDVDVEERYSKPKADVEHVNP